MSKQCLDCPYALIKEKDNKQSRTKNIQENQDLYGGKLLK